MELLLNFVWLLLGVSLILILRAAPKCRKQYVLALGCAACVLLLLFPGISVSDDLHAQAFVAEDSNTSKQLQQAKSSVSTSAFNAPFTAIVLFLLAIWCNSLWCVRVAGPARYLSALLDRPTLGRAPPAFRLA